MKEILDGIRLRRSASKGWITSPDDVDTLFNLIDSQAREYTLMQAHKDSEIERLKVAMRECLVHKNMGRVILILRDALSGEE